MPKTRTMVRTKHNTLTTTKTKTGPRTRTSAWARTMTNNVSKTRAKTWGCDNDWCLGWGKDLSSG